MWPPCAFGCMGELNTSLFRGPPRKRVSLRLFLLQVVGKKPLPNVETGVAISIAAHTTGSAEHKRNTRILLAFAVPGDLRFTLGTLANRTARAHTVGDDPFSPRLVLTVTEDLAP